MRRRTSVPCIGAASRSRKNGCAIRRGPVTLVGESDGGRRAWLPMGDDRIEEVDVSTTVLQENERIIFSTACWRRYLGTWEIRDGQLFLNELKGRYRIRDGKPLQADWFTGVLRIPKGKLLHLVNMGFASVYERELHIKVENGRVVASREIDNTGTPFDLGKLAHANLPGGENRFPGDTDL